MERDAQKAQRIVIDKQSVLVMTERSGADLHAQSNAIRSAASIVCHSEAGDIEPEFNHFLHPRRELRDSR